MYDDKIDLEKSFLDSRTSAGSSTSRQLYINDPKIYIIYIYRYFFIVIALVFFRRLVSYDSVSL